MSIIYNPHLIANGVSFYLPIPITQIEAKHSWKGKYYEIPLGVDMFTGRVKGPISLTVAGIVCIDRYYTRLSEGQLWDQLYLLEDALNGGSFGYYTLVVNDFVPAVAFLECYTQGFTYSKPEGLVQYIPWSFSAKCVRPVVQF